MVNFRRILKNKHNQILNILSTIFDSTFLLRALDLAKTRRGFCAPNPSVGAVIVKKGQILAEGRHWGSGYPHAEADALSKLSSEEAKDATLYVSLEPCCHTNKKTPPCTELLIARGIKEVYCGKLDPNPQVSGQGMQKLLSAGIICQPISLPEVDDFYKSYQYWWQNKQPFITAKLALSLDGKIAGANYQPVVISGTDLQEWTHQQRYRADALLTTVKTIIHDDPALNVRLSGEITAKPLYILDRQLNLPLTARVLKTAKFLTIFHGSGINQEKRQILINNGIICHEIPTQNNLLGLTEIANQIGKDGIHDLWIEAGGQCFQAFAEAGLLKCGILYVSPKWLGTNAISAFQTQPKFFNKVKDIRWQVYGRDVIGELLW